MTRTSCLNLSASRVARNALSVSSAHEAKIQVPPISGQSEIRGCRVNLLVKKWTNAFCWGALGIFAGFVETMQKGTPARPHFLQLFDFCIGRAETKTSCVFCEESSLVPPHTHRSTSNSRPEKAAPAPLRGYSYAARDLAPGRPPVICWCGCSRSPAPPGLGRENPGLLAALLLSAPTLSSIQQRRHTMIR